MQCVKMWSPPWYWTIQLNCLSGYTDSPEEHGLIHWLYSPPMEGWGLILQYGLENTRWWQWLDLRIGGTRLELAVGIGGICSSTPLTIIKASASQKVPVSVHLACMNECPNLIAVSLSQMRLITVNPILHVSYHTLCDEFQEVHLLPQDKNNHLHNHQIKSVQLVSFQMLWATWRFSGLLAFFLAQQAILFAHAYFPLSRHIGWQWVAAA